MHICDVNSARWCTARWESHGTLLLALTARGLGTCVQVSIAGYPQVVRDQLDIPEELTILCGLAVGYADTSFAGNTVRVGRDSVDKHATFLDG